MEFSSIIDFVSQEYVIGTLLVLLAIYIFKRAQLFVRDITPIAKMGLFLWLVLTLIAGTGFLAAAIYTVQFFPGIQGHLLANFVALLALLLISFLVGPDVRKEVFGASNSYQKLLKGILYGVIAFPLITGVVTSVNFVLGLFGAETKDQLAFVFIKNLMDKGWIFYVAALTVSVVVPIAEEILFRGYILGALSRLLQPHLVALACGAIFAAFHLSQEQGLTNIAFFIGLTLFGLLASNVKSAENSLYASIGMHAAFNALSLSFLIIQGPL